MNLIDAQPDRFGGVITNPDALPDDPGVFKHQLQQSLDSWTAEGFKAVWLEIPNEKVALVPVAVDNGFSYHHAADSRVVLTRPLVDGAYIPPYATHYIGVGGVVLNDADELLVVSERYRRGTGPSYKLPGGALLPGALIVDAALPLDLEDLVSNAVSEFGNKLTDKDVVLKLVYLTSTPKIGPGDELVFWLFSN